MHESSEPNTVLLALSKSIHLKSGHLLKANLGGLLAWEFLLFHWVEVRRYQDIKNHHSVDEDPIFKGNKVWHQLHNFRSRVQCMSLTGRKISILTAIRQTWL